MVKTANKKGKTKKQISVDWRKYGKKTIYVATKTKDRLRKIKALSDDLRIKKLLDGVGNVRKNNTRQTEKRRSNDKSVSSRKELCHDSGYLEIVK